MIRAADFDAQWHMIGHLQRNKAKQAVELFDMVESLDSLRPGRRTGKTLCCRSEKTMPVLIEVNSGREENKTGVMPEECVGAGGMVSAHASPTETNGFDDDGPAHRRPGTIAAVFYKETGRIYEEITANANCPICEMRILSMGMSNSYRVAIEEGANLIRLGTSIFGPQTILI